MPASAPLDCRFDDSIARQGEALGRMDLRTRDTAHHDDASGLEVVPILKANLNAAACETWLCGDGDSVRHGREGPWRYAYGQEFLFAATHVPLARAGIATSPCTAAVCDAYAQAFALLRGVGATVFRMWNYIPDINADNAEGLEVYRDFCRGRAQALEALGIGPAEMPAASGIGASANGPRHIAIAMLASRTARITAIENPAQVAAYRYPERYGPRPPTFARATHLALPSGDQAVFVSGTASIVGHETVHEGDVARQCATALDHIATLLSAPTLAQHVLSGRFTLRDLDAVKVYVRHARDLPTVRRLCEAALDPCAQVAWLCADLCRSELLVEIEGWVPFARRPA